MAFRCSYSGVHRYNVGSILSGSEVEDRRYTYGTQDACTCGGELWTFDQIEHNAKTYSSSARRLMLCVFTTRKTGH